MVVYLSMYKINKKIIKLINHKDINIFLRTIGFVGFTLNDKVRRNFSLRFNYKDLIYYLQFSADFSKIKLQNF